MPESDARSVEVRLTPLRKENQNCHMVSLLSAGLVRSLLGIQIIFSFSFYISFNIIYFNKMLLFNSI